MYTYLKQRALRWCFFCRVAFAECFWGYTDCLGHSTKPPFLVVIVVCHKVVDCCVMWWRREYLHWVSALMKLWGVMLGGRLNHCWIMGGSEFKPLTILICVEMVRVSCSKLTFSSKNWSKRIGQRRFQPLWRDFEKKWHMKVLKTQVIIISF